MTFTISELAAMWKAGQRDEVRKAILESKDPQEACENLINLVEWVEENDGTDEAIDLCANLSICAELVRH
jgi:hypothetical protein